MNEKYLVRYHNRVFSESREKEFSDFDEVKEFAQTIDTLFEIVDVEIFQLMNIEF